MILIVPYKPDSPERKANLEKFMEHYKGFDIFVGHHYSERHNVFNGVAKSDRYHDLIALADVDAIVPIEQMNQAIFELENGADMVYPYDKVMNVRQDGTEEDTWPQRFVHGLMVCFNKQKFLDFGGENTEFKGYGWEDLERYYRALHYGLNVERIKGTCYHNMHPRDGFKNPHFNHNRLLMKQARSKYFEKANAQVDEVKRVVPVKVGSFVV